MTRSDLRFMTLMGLAAVGLACGTPTDRSESAAPPGKVSAFVSILPQAYFVERIGGEHVAVAVLVGPGESPATYEPTPRQMAQLAESDVYFAIGVPFEAALLPRLRDGFDDLEIVETQAGIDVGSEAPGDAEGWSPDHPPHDRDPHVWLSPRHAEVIAETIADALKRIDPAHASDFVSNLRALSADLQRVDTEIASLLEPLRGKEIFVFHPAYGAFVEAYGLKQVAIEVEGQSPSAKQLAELIEKARSHNVRAVFVQPQFSHRTADTVAESVGAEIVTLDPLSRDYKTNLKSMALKIRDALTDAEETVAETAGH